MSSTIQIRVDDELKMKSDQLFKDLGTDTTTAITSDVISLNIIKYKSIAQILNVLADGYMIGWSLICCQ